MSIEIRLRLRIELNDLLWRQYPLFMRKGGIGEKQEPERSNAHGNRPAIVQTAPTIPRRRPHPRKSAAHVRRLPGAAVIDFEIKHPGSAQADLESLTVRSHGGPCRERVR